MATEIMSVAETWQERIDRPQKKGGWYPSINKQAVKRMTDAAVEVLPGASGRCTDIYIFEDGSSLCLHTRIFSMYEWANGYIIHPVPGLKKEGSNGCSAQPGRVLSLHNMFG